MISIEEMHDILDALAEELPKDFFKDLNGGILLLPEAKISPYARNSDLFILGEYQRGGSMGRLIKIYYGSFEKLYSLLDKEALTVELRHVLRHEFTHHIESLAGERGLEIKDEHYKQKYLLGEKARSTYNKSKSKNKDKNKDKSKDKSKSKRKDKSK